MHHFEYVAPASLDEACRVLAENEGRAKVFAGGAAMMILMRNSLITPDVVVDIKQIPGLAGIEQVPGKGVRIGALTTHRMIEQSELLKQLVPVLPEMAHDVASVQVRNRGTIGGNLCHAEPAADPPTLLFALDATVTVTGPTGERTLSMDDFIVGYYENAMDSSELLKEIWVPEQPAGTGAYYLKFISRTAMDMCLLGVAAVVRLDTAGICRHARIVIGNCGDKPERALAVERQLVGQPLTDELIAGAAQSAAMGLSPVSDMRGTAEYRLAMAKLSTRRALIHARDRAAAV